MTNDEINSLLGLLAIFESECLQDFKVTPGSIKNAFHLLMLRGRFPVCALCHHEILTIEDFSWDHIVPHSKGGSNRIYNLQPTHRCCNMDKGCTITESDIDAVCNSSEETRDDILARKKKRKNAYRKIHNSKWIKPWDIDDHQK